jgi:hypothetical protein
MKWIFIAQVAVVTGEAVGQFFLDLDLDKLRVEVENSKTKD